MVRVREGLNECDGVSDIESDKDCDKVFIETVSNAVPEPDRVGETEADVDHVEVNFAWVSVLDWDGVLDFDDVFVSDAVTTESDGDEESSLDREIVVDSVHAPSVGLRAELNEPDSVEVFVCASVSLTERGDVCDVERDVEPVNASSV